MYIYTYIYVWLVVGCLCENVCACMCGATFESGVFGAFRVGLDICICVYMSILKVLKETAVRDVVTLEWA